MYIPCNSLKTRCVSGLREEQGRDPKESNGSLSHEDAVQESKLHSDEVGVQTKQNSTPGRQNFVPENVQVVVTCSKQ